MRSSLWMKARAISLWAIGRATSALHALEHSLQNLRTLDMATGSVIPAGVASPSTNSLSFAIALPTSCTLLKPQRTKLTQTCRMRSMTPVPKGDEWCDNLMIGLAFSPINSLFFLKKKLGESYWIKRVSTRMTKVLSLCGTIGISAWSMFFEEIEFSNQEFHPGVTCPRLGCQCV